MIYKNVQCFYVCNNLELKKKNICYDVKENKTKVYFVVPADMTHNNIIFVCNSHHIYSLIRDIGTGNSLVNNTDITTKLSKDKILENHQYDFFSYFLLLWHLKQHWRTKSTVSHWISKMNRVILLDLQNAHRNLF